MLRTTSAPNLFHLQKIKSRNLLADWLFVICYDLSIFQLPLCWLKCCKAIYLSLLIVWGSCSVGKVSWYISYLTVIEFPLKRRNKNRRFSPNQHHNLTFSGFKTKSSGGNNLQSPQKFNIMNIAALPLVCIATVMTYPLPWWSLRGHQKGVISPLLASHPIEWYHPPLDEEILRSLARVWGNWFFILVCGWVSMSIKCFAQIR